MADKSAFIRGSSVVDEAMVGTLKARACANDEVVAPKPLSLVGLGFLEENADMGVHEFFG